MLLRYQAIHDVKSRISHLQILELDLQYVRQCFDEVQ